MALQYFHCNEMISRAILTMEQIIFIEIFILTEYTNFKNTNMKFYNLDTQFTFGKFEGKTLKEVIKIDVSYLEWCSTNLDHFYLLDETIDLITKIQSDFRLSATAKEVLEKKYDTWETSQYDNNRDDDYERPQSYEDWLNDEFGDEAETAYWNMD